ncbi:hypothetical protein FHS14_005605 [Paenibacillus baekrokdamisoli]|nr:hypothetical protein [Paenibacillus baekrokdamisoli]
MIKPRRIDDERVIFARNEGAMVTKKLLINLFLLF